MLRATTACTFSTSQLPKVVRAWCVLYMLTWACASRHNGVHFLDISTSKRAPTLRCFAHFDLEMCFAPQRRALFRHLNFQKWSEHGVFCTFWLGNALRATMACTFSTSQLTRRFSERSFRPPGATNLWQNAMFRGFRTFSRTCIFCVLTLFSSLTLPTSAFLSVHIVGSLTSKLPSIRF